MQKQSRESVCIEVRIPMTLAMPGGSVMSGTSVDMSVGGAAVTVMGSVSTRGRRQLDYPMSARR